MPAISLAARISGVKLERGADFRRKGCCTWRMDGWYEGRGRERVREIKGEGEGREGERERWREKEYKYEGITCVVRMSIQYLCCMI